MDIESTVSYPLEGEGPTQMLIGGVLTLLSVLILPFFLVFGYYYEVMHETIEGESSPPKFTSDNIVRLSVKGIGVFGVTMIYAFLWMITTAITWVLLSPDAFQAPQQIDTTPEPLAILGVLVVSAITAGILGYLANASFISYAANDSFLSAFSIGNIIKITTSGEYLMMNLILIVVGVASVIGFFVLSLIPIIGLAGPFLQFPLFVIVWHALGMVGNNLSGEIR